MSRLDRMYYGTNTKMTKTPRETVEHIRRFAALTEDLKDEINRFIIPSAPAISMAVEAAENTGIIIGAQNINGDERGQYTGEISVLMLEELGADLCMIGHSDRRHMFGETDFEMEKKVAASARHGFTTLLCIGETIEQKKYNLSKEVFATQLKIGLNSLPAELAKEKLWIAYEPVWAIGSSGTPATPEYANESHGMIKDILAEIYGDEIGRDIPVLYGGSINHDNSIPLTEQPYIDGLFTTRCAADPESFNQLVRETLPVFRLRKK